MEETETEIESGETDVQDTSIRDALESAFEEAETEAALAAPVEDALTEPPGDSRTRDEHGRFTKKEASVESTPTPQPNLEPKAATEKPGTAQDVPSLETLPHLTSDEKAVISKAPPEVQQLLARKLDETHRKTSEAGRAISKYREFEEMLAPRRQQLALNGVSEAQYAKQVFTAADMLDANPIEGIKYFIRHYGIDPTQLTEAQPTEVNPVDQRIARLEQALAHSARAAQQAKDAALTKTVDEFRNATDAQGKPLRPYLASVAAEFVPLISAVRSAHPEYTPQQVMQEAYDRAVYANPNIRQQIQAEQAKAAEAERLANARKVAAEAKARGSSVVGSPGTGATPAKSTDIRSLLEAAYEGRA